MIVKSKQIFISQKTENMIRVERIVERAQKTRDTVVEVSSVSYNNGKYTKLKGSDRILVVDSIRRNYLPVVL